MTLPVRKAHLDTLAVGLLLVCCLVWGLQQVVVKATLPEVAPLFQAALRFAGATLLLVLWCRWRGIALFDADGSGRAGWLAGLLFAGEFVCIYIGLQHTTASRLTVFLYTAPFWVALLLPLRVPVEGLRAIQWAGLLLAFGAVAYAFLEGLTGVAGQATAWGDGLGLLAGLLWGLTTVVIRASRLVQIRAEKLLFYQLGCSALVLPWLSWGLGESWQLPLTAFVGASLFLQTVVGAFASYLVWMWMLGRYPATHLSSFVFLTPLFALLFGALWLSEPVTPRLLLALTLVAVGIVIVNRTPRSSAHDAKK